MYMGFPLEKYEQRVAIRNLLERVHKLYCITENTVDEAAKIIGEINDKDMGEQKSD